MDEWTFTNTTAVVEPTSTLEYLNSQLVANGFVPHPGLQLVTLQGKDLERTVRCLLSLLSQRVDDMRRYESAGSQVKTLTFESERLRRMLKVECEKSCNAEKETNLFKSKLATAYNKVEEVQKKCQMTLTELTRTRSTLNSVRTSAMMETRRKEQETEKLVERMQRIAGGSFRATSRAEELIPPVPREEAEGKTLAEEALELAETELSTLKGERERLHDVFVWIAREVSAMVADGTEIDPASCIASPVDTLTPLVSRLRTRLLAKKPDDAEYSRLQGIISDLNKELEHKETLLKKLENHFEDLKGRSSVDVTMNEGLSMERARLDMYKLELEDQRRQLGAAELAMAEERAEIEAERLVILEERHALEEQQRVPFEPPSTESTSSESTLMIGAESSDDCQLQHGKDSSPRKRKIREFVACTTRGAVKSPKRRRERLHSHQVEATPQLLHEELPPSMQLSLSDDTPMHFTEANPPPPLVLPSTPNFSPLPSPPGALSLNGIGFELDSIDEEPNQSTPVIRKRKGSRSPKKKFPKHAYSPARPSPLFQQLNSSVNSSNGDAEEKENTPTAGGRPQTEILQTSTFPQMPAGLAQKLGAIENVGKEPSTSSGSELRESKMSTTNPSEPHKPGSKKSKEKENDSRKAKPVISASTKLGTGNVKTVANNVGARRVRVDAVAPARGGWR